ncbi:AAA family ATPase [Kitasatospora gansuensis]
MYISRLEVENLRGFRGVRNVDLDLTRPDGSHAGWTVLAGPNGAGKTTLLAALAAALGEETDPAGWLAPGQDEGGVRLDGAHWRVTRTEDGVSARRNGVLGFWAGYRARRELTDGIGWLVGQQLHALERQPGAVELVAGVRALLDDGLLPATSGSAGSTPTASRSSAATASSGSPVESPPWCAWCSTCWPGSTRPTRSRSW